MNLTVTHFIEAYLSYRLIKAAPSILRSERSKAKKLVMLIGKRPISAVTHSDILMLIQTLSTKSKYANKTINEFLIILRAIFNRAKRDGLIVNNPMEGVSNLRVFHDEPMPFTLNELQMMNQVPVENEDGRHLYQLGVLTGLRICELLALTWEEIKLDNAQLRVRIALVEKIHKTPKTAGSVRTVELCEPAIEILQRQLKITGGRKPVRLKILQADNKTQKIEYLSPVFYNSKTNKPFLDAKQYNKSFFAPLLAVAGVPHRGAGQLRHTFASQALTAGISKEWTARQMGHTSTSMIDAHYGRWMCQDAPNNVIQVAKHFSSVFRFDHVNLEKTEASSPLSEHITLPVEQDFAPTFPVGALISSPHISNQNMAFTTEQVKVLLQQHPQLLMQCISQLLGQVGGEGA